MLIFHKTNLKFIKIRLHSDSFYVEINDEIKKKTLFKKKKILRMEIMR